MTRRQHTPGPWADAVCHVLTDCGLYAAMSHFRLTREEVTGLVWWVRQPERSGPCPMKQYG